MCSLVLPAQANGKPNRNDLGTIHVYRDSDGDMASLEISTSLTDKTNKTVKARKDKKSDIAKLCLDGYSLALIGDVPAGIPPVGDQGKLALAGSESQVDPNDGPVHLGDHAKANWGLNVIPSNFSITRQNNVFYGNIVGVGTYFNTSGFFATGVRPAGKTTQWLTFNANSSALASGGDHVAIALFLTSSYQLGIIGNGFIIGNNSAYSAPNPSLGIGGCQNPAINTQIEAFWKSGNATYTTTCAPFAVTDGVTSSYVLHANMYQDVMYQRSTSGQTYTGTKNTASQQPATTAGGFNPDEGGILIGWATLGSGNYSITFSSVSTGWF